MKHAKKLLIVSLALLANINTAVADLNADAETIFNWAEKNFTEFFPTQDTTKTLDVWRYRYYPQTGIYAGVNTQDNAVYLLGGAFGNTPWRFKSVNETLALLQPANTGIACDTAKAPEGVSYSQSGNTVKVTTNGRCIAIPKASICTPAAPTKTGISALSENSVKSFTLEGLKFNSPDIQNIFEPIITKSASAKTCQINVPQSFTDLTLESDVCFDVTDSLRDLASQPLLLTVTPPVNMRLQSTVTSKTVNDCFADTSDNGPIIITDAFTNQVWTKDNGVFKEVIK